MKLIGLRRALILVVLLVLNLAIAGIYLGVMGPMQSEALMQRDSMLSQISSLRSQIENVKQELALFNENLPKYEALEKRGFFLEQDRFKIGRDLGDVRTLAGLRGFSYDVANIAKVENAIAQSMQMRLINSRIQINKVASFLDNDFYSFLDMMHEAFPAHVRVHSFSVRKGAPLNETSLNSIVQNQPVDLIVAEAAFDWMTVVPDVPAQTPGGQP